MSKMKDYIIDQHNKEYIKLRSLKKIESGRYTYKIGKYDFDIIQCNDHGPKKEWVIDVIENGNVKYRLYHDTLKECKIQLEVMENSPYLIE